MLNKKGLGEIKAIGIAIAIIGVVYLILTGLATIKHVTGDPIFPTLTAIKSTIDFFMLIILFVLVQGILIYLYFLVAKYSKKLYLIYKNKILKWGLNMKHRALLSR